MPGRAVAGAMWHPGEDSPRFQVIFRCTGTPRDSIATCIPEPLEQSPEPHSLTPPDSITRARYREPTLNAQVRPAVETTVTVNRGCTPGLKLLPLALRLITTSPDGQSSPGALSPAASAWCLAPCALAPVVTFLACLPGSLLSLGDGVGDGLEADGDGDGDGLGDGLEIIGLGKLVGALVGALRCAWLNEVSEAVWWVAEAPPTAQASKPSTARPAASANSLLRQ